MANLRLARAATGAWSDAQRDKLDRHSLDPLAADGQQLLDALRRAAYDIAAAEAQLS